MTGFPGLPVDRLKTALWVFDIDRSRVIWANRAALKIWRADSIEELAARDMGADMSPAVAARLRQYQEDFIARDASFTEIWTLYPQGKPVAVNAVFNAARLPDGRMGMLCEASAEYKETPESLRSADALLHTTVMITLYDLDGRPLYRNPAARAAAIGVDGADQAAFADRFVEAAEYERIRADIDAVGEASQIARMRTAAGPRWHEVTARTCRDAATGAPALLVSETDMTEAREYQTELEESRAKLEDQAQELRELHRAAEAASRAKSQFLAHMSHELRTPLNAIIGFSDVTRQGTFGPVEPRRYGDYAELIHESGRLLLDLINDILDISKIEAGKFELRPEVIQAKALVETSSRLVSGMAKEAGVRLVTEVTDEVDTLYGDARAIKQIIINLLSNAVKFTPTGGRIELLIKPGPAGASTITVRDNGIGMDPEEIGRALDPFGQIDSSIAQNHRGTGLGLALVKNLVEIHGGHLDIISRRGEGTSVTAVLPAAFIAE
ncbi:MAG: PAS domain-containing sensor histidine kinase [Rhodospirillaceae bacterium]|nr:PAS domain-containing sensor histidine kinase [Rhodospirillaceae bacterium]